MCDSVKGNVTKCNLYKRLDILVTVLSSVEGLVNRPCYSPRLKMH